MALAASHSKATVLMLFIHLFFSVAPIAWGSVFGLCFVMQRLVTFLVFQSS